MEKDQKLEVVDANTAEEKKRTRKPRMFPAFSLKEALVIAQTIEDSNAGRPYSRLSLADNLRKSPESSGFRYLIVTSASYGITTGSYAAPQIVLTERGKSIVSPRNPEERTSAMIEAAMSIPLYKKLYEHFDQHKIPPYQTFRNVLVRDYGVVPEHAEECFKHFVDDGRLTGLIRNVAGGDRVSIHDAGGIVEHVSNEEHIAGLDAIEQDAADFELPLPPADSHAQENAVPPEKETKKTNDRVFITHGKNREIVDQLKQILIYGKLDPIVAEEHETTAKPVPDKVLNDMRSCSAGIIHIESEEVLLDRSGKEHHKVNENVLIEIGAALALYGTNVILLVQKGVQLPSNLQGLYRCEYEGDQLDFNAFMKLLRAFNDFKKE